MSNVAFVHVGKTFHGDIRALCDVNLEIADGEYFVVVGPSGSGKTTLLRLIAGLDLLTAGDILIAGRRMNDVPPAERDVAMVFQSAALYPHLTVRRNLAFGLACLRVDAREFESRIDQVAEMLAISTLLDRMPAELSGGERKRVAIGRAVVRRPRVLLLDEPLNDLDTPLRAQLRLELTQIRETLGMTVIHVTHDQNEALALGDRIGVMREGQLQQVASPQTLYDCPANAFVASFVGSPGMNLIPGELRHGRFIISNGCNSEGIDLPMGAGTARACNFDGRVLLGVRPEELGRDRGGVCLPPIVVERVESLGHESIAHFQLAGGRHVVRFPGITAVRRGDSLLLSLAEDRLCWFAEADGARLN